MGAAEAGAAAVVEVVAAVAAVVVAVAAVVVAVAAVAVAVAAAVVVEGVYLRFCDNFYIPAKS